MKSEQSGQYDVVVVGGGPSGSSVASFVAMQGHRVLLLEQETFPRYQIGESLLPATIHGICGLLGVQDKIEAAGFMRKQGGTFRWGTSPDPWSFSFAISPRIAGPTSHAFQVERAKFDKILLDRARELGVEVRERCAAGEVLQDGDGRVTGVSYTDADGKRQTVSSTMLVDASGNRSRLSRAAGKRVYSEFFRSIAVFGYFAGGERLPEPRSGNIFCTTFEHGWFWYIPLTPELTSVGAVVSRDLAELIQGDTDEAFQRMIDACPDIKRMVSGVARATQAPYDQTRVRKDYSYANDHFWTPGMVLVGDSACFVDPVFSSGVHLATYGALLAARSINSTLAGLVDEEAAFIEYEDRYRHEYGLFYEFLMSFYDLNVDEDSYFWQAKKISRTSVGELEAFAGLVGGVASGEEVLVEPGQLRSKFASTSSELSHSIDPKNRISDDDATSLYQSSILGEVMKESVTVQASAFMDDHAEPGEQLFEGGLVTSPDGMHWIRPDAVPAP